MSQEAHIFISYAREDREFALRLARDLRSEGVNIWMDQLDIPPGVRWDRAIEQALRTCDRLLIILSPASVASENVMDEVAFALNREKRIVPVLHCRCEIPLRLLRLQYIDFTSDYNQGLTALLAELQETAAPPRARPLVPPTKPFPWLVAAIGGVALLVLLVVIVLTAKPWLWFSTPTPTTVATATATLQVATPTPRPTATPLPPTSTAAMIVLPTVTPTPVPAEMPTPTVTSQPTSTPTETPQPTPTPTETPRPTPIPTETPRPTPTPTETPWPTPTPSCPAVSGPFSAIWNSVQGTIGCAASYASTGFIVEENFEGGKMFWREPIDYAQILALFNDGTWQVVKHSPFTEGSPEFSCPDANTPSECPPTNAQTWVWHGVV